MRKATAQAPTSNMAMTFVTRKGSLCRDSHKASPLPRAKWPTEHSSSVQNSRRQSFQAEQYSTTAAPDVKPRTQHAAHQAAHACGSLRATNRSNRPPECMPQGLYSRCAGEQRGRCCGGPTPSRRSNVTFGGWSRQDWVLDGAACGVSCMAVLHRRCLNVEWQTR